MDDDTDFDIDAWLTDAQPPQRSVPVYGRGDLVAALQELAARPREPGDARLGGDPVDAEISAIREQLEQSKRVFRVRGLLHSDRRRLLDAHTVRDEHGKPVKDADGDDTMDLAAYEAAVYAQVIVSPRMTVEQVKRLRERIGEAQWEAIGSAIEAASAEPISVPLSRLGSGSTRTS